MQRIIFFLLTNNICVTCLSSSSYSSRYCLQVGGTAVPMIEEEKEEEQEETESMWDIKMFGLPRLEEAAPGLTGIPEFRTFLGVKGQFHFLLSLLKTGPLMREECRQSRQRQERISKTWAGSLTMVQCIFIPWTPTFPEVDFIPGNTIGHY